MAMLTKTKSYLTMVKNFNLLVEDGDHFKEDKEGSEENDIHLLKYT